MFTLFPRIAFLGRSGSNVRTQLEIELYDNLKTFTKFRFNENRLLYTTC